MILDNLALSHKHQASSLDFSKNELRILITKRTCGLGC